jgi:UDP-glucuronate 4-epimerase
MAYFSFTRSILEGKPIDVYNNGMMQRDFTYIDDIVEGIVRVCDRIPQPGQAWNSAAPDPSTSFAPYRIYNIGNNQPVELLKFIETLEHCLGKTAIKNMLPIQPGDVPATFADVDELMHDVGFKPETSIEDGVSKFVAWYREYYTL